MLATTYSQMSLSRLVSLYNDDRLNLEPAFQRKSVWTRLDRQRLIISVFDGIPLPSIYMYRRVSSTGFVEYDVIDGKQRLETLMLFAGEGPLVATHDALRFKGDCDGRLPMDWRYWQDLPANLRREFKKTKLPSIQVEGEMAEIAELFVSINATGKKLTGQEKRHAFHEHSNVLRMATKLAEDHRDYFARHKIFSEAQMQRMTHIEFCTELMLYAYNGVHMNKKSKLDDVIRGDNLDTRECNRAIAEVTSALKVAAVILPNLKSTRFRQRADFYSFVCALIQLKNNNLVVTAHHSPRNDLAGQLLTGFGLGVEEVSEWSNKAKKIPSGHADHTKYLMTVKEGTDSLQQRKRRAAILTDVVLEGVFDSKDTKRTFSAQQRRILWNRSSDKRCAICRLRIDSWSSMHADHVQAYIKGGKTDVGNGAITHQWCNQSKGAR